jgi:1-acyl-sn-glycerol-3-phosphate acyltransferase
MRLFLKLDVRGREYVPRSGAVLLVANHVSVLDPPLIAGLTPRRVSFLAKAELFRLPGFGWLLPRLGARPVRRQGGDPGALRTGLRVLQEGGTLLMFPEGTRGEEGVLRPPKPGAGMLAVLSGASVVPVSVQGSGRAWPRGRRLPRPARVRVTFGRPMRFGDGARAPRKESYEAASREMMAAIARLKDAAGSAPPSPASPRGSSEQSARRV